MKPWQPDVDLAEPVPPPPPAKTRAERRAEASNKGPRYTRKLTPKDRRRCRAIGGRS